MVQVKTRVFVASLNIGSGLSPFGWATKFTFLLIPLLSKIAKKDILSSVLTIFGVFIIKICSFLAVSFYNALEDSEVLIFKTLIFSHLKL